MPRKVSMVLVGVDVGGTFTDVVAFDDAHPEDIQVVKVPTDTEKPERGVLDGLKDQRKKAKQVSVVAHASTIATNALLTHTGLARTALITNQGFRDVLEIGRQRRPELYHLNTRRPTPLVRRRDRLVVRGRIASNGAELEPLNIADAREAAEKIKNEGFQSVALVLLNSYANPKHEQRVAHILSRSGFKGRVDLSSEVDPQYREYERTSTTVVNAALGPLVAEYLSRLAKKFQQSGFNCPIYVMNSDGTVSTIARAAERPISVIESGPAAGVLSSKNLAANLGLDKIITFDMGGTTAKAGVVIGGEPDLSYEFEAAGKTHSGRSIKGSGYPVRYPFIDLAEVSSGGGTIAWVDEAEALHVGPQSAGGTPGPAAYGKGGTEPTVTDANIVLGRVNANHLLGGALTLHPELAKKAVREKIGRKLNVSLAEAAEGIIKTVHHNMARAISLVSIERGRDPRQFTLISFGGAGPMHSCELAEELGINRIIVPLHPGLFSALGLLTADLARTFTRPVMRPLSQDLSRFFSELEKQAEKSVRREGFSKFTLRESVDLRYRGQSYEITLPYDQNRDLVRDFRARHFGLYGYWSDDPIEAVNARVTVVVGMPNAAREMWAPRLGNKGDISPASTRSAWIANVRAETPVYTREKLRPSAHGTGRCIIEEYDSTTVIPNNWFWMIDHYGDIELHRR